MQNCQHPSEPCRHPQDCVMRMTYIRTTGGRPDPTPRQARRRSSITPGDCGVVAVATVTGLSYEESRRRLHMVDQALFRLRPMLLALQQQAPDILVPTPNAPQDPTRGTNVLTLEALLAIHRFNPHRPDQCLQQDTAPRVVLGEHGDTAHAMPTRAGHAYGTADPSQGTFRPITTWALETPLTTQQHWYLTKQFARDETLYASLRVFLAI